MIDKDGDLALYRHNQRAESLSSQITKLREIRAKEVQGS